MRDIRNLNIWKKENSFEEVNEEFYKADINELNLSVRSYNCLKRAGCHRVEDILPYLENDCMGLRKIRNLGKRSEEEIISRIREMEFIYRNDTHTKNKKPTPRLVKPAKDIWDMEIGKINLSKRSQTVFASCGIKKIGDIYTYKAGLEPGWYSVRELFEKIIEIRKL